jgi:hypothetical protein
MTADPNPQPFGGASTLIEDLFLTDCFLIKGRLANKFQRLARMLDDADRTYLAIEDAVMASLRGTEVIRTPRVLVNTKEIILAHELIDVAGDAVQRQLATNEKPVRIRAFYSGAVQMELAGKIEPAAYEPGRGGRRNFFVMIEPTIRGLHLEQNPELRVLRELSYAIIRKEKLAYIYDFS